MGQRGPKPLPKNVHMLRGNASKRPLSDLTDSVEPDVEIPGCPKHLLPEAKKEWKRIAPELEGLGLVSKIDRTALALYCQEYAWWVWHDTALQRAIKLADQAQKDAEAKGQVYDGGDGFTQRTPNGHLAYNPHWVARNKAAQAMDKFLASFGMSPSSRGRVTASSRQPSLPGFEPKDGFGAM